MPYSNYKPFKESENPGLQADVFGDRSEQPFTRSHRPAGRDVVPRSITTKELDVVEQTALTTTDVVSVADGAGANLVLTITSVKEGIFLPQVFIAPYVSQLAGSNQWPHGSFFSAANAVQTAANYDLAGYYDVDDTTDTVVVYRARLNNHTGSTVNVWWKYRVRIIGNG